MQPLGTENASANVTPSSPLTSRITHRPSDLASFDSSDTWASCNLFPSIADLATSSPVDSNRLVESSLYVNPTGHAVSKTGSFTDPLRENTVLLSPTLFNDDSQMDPNQRRTSKANKPRPRFKEAPTLEDDEATVPLKKESGKKFRKSKPSFLTGRGIVSATRFLNYHFLSLQSGDNRGRGSPDRKKSILKRPDGASNTGRVRSDSDQETEKLIPDSGASASDAGSGTEAFSSFSPVVHRLKPGSTSPKLRQQSSKTVHQPKLRSQTRLGQEKSNSGQTSFRQFDLQHSEVQSGRLDGEEKHAIEERLAERSAMEKDRENQHLTRTPSQFNSGQGLGIVLDDWPFADSSPTEEMNVTTPTT